jgi:hypothetical protein
MVGGKAGVMMVLLSLPAVCAAHEISGWKCSGSCET